MAPGAPGSAPSSLAGAWMIRRKQIHDRDTMIQVDIDTTIGRPLEDVFERLADIPGYNEWMPGGGLFMGCEKETGGPVREGTAYADRTVLGTARGEVAAFDPPRKIVFHYVFEVLGFMLMEGWPGYELEPVGDGVTRLRHRARATLYGPFRVLRPFIGVLARRERRRTVEALKASLEE